MPGFNFRVALDLTSFFDDHRSKCYIYVDVNKLRTIEDLESHIKSRFEIEDNVFFSTNGYYIPSSESIEILNTNEILRVCRDETLIRGGSSQSKKKLKTKKTQTDYVSFRRSESFLSMSDNAVMPVESVGAVSRNGLLGAGDTQVIYVAESSDEKQSRKKRKEAGDRVATDDPSPKRGRPRRDSTAPTAEEGSVRFSRNSLERPKKKRKKDVAEELPIACSSSVQLIVDQFRQKYSNKVAEEENAQPPPEEKLADKEKEKDNAENCMVVEQNDGDGTPPEATEGGEDDDDTRPKRRRVRRRRRKVKELTHHLGDWSPIGKERESSGQAQNHIRFTSADESEMNSSHPLSAPPSTVSRWDEKPLGRTSSLPSQRDGSPLTLSEVLRYQSTSTLIFDCSKGESADKPPSGDALPVLMPVLKKEVDPNGSQPDLEVTANTTSSPLKGLPRKNDLIAFKIMRLSDEYTPVLSKHITAKVLNYDSRTCSVKLQVLNGLEELAQPKGRFSLDDSTEESPSNIIELNWNEMLEPLLIFP